MKPLIEGHLSKVRVYWAKGVRDPNMFLDIHSPCYVTPKASHCGAVMQGTHPLAQPVMYATLSMALQQHIRLARFRNKAVYCVHDSAIPYSRQHCSRQLLIPSNYWLLLM